MAKYSPPSIWTDEFNKPKIDGLRDLLDADLKKVFDKVSRHSDRLLNLNYSGNLLNNPNSKTILALYL